VSTRSKSEAYILRNLNEREQNPSKPLHRQKESFTSDWQHHKLFLYPHKMSFRVQNPNMLLTLGLHVVYSNKKIMKKAGRALCKYSRIDEHTLSSHL